jgi:hypothetical protein
MLNPSKNLWVALSAGFLLATAIASTPATNNTAVMKGGKKLVEGAALYKAQQFPLAGTDHLAVELRYTKGNKLHSLFFLNAGSQPVAINMQNQEFIIPVNETHQAIATPMDTVVVTVRPYDATMENNIKSFVPTIDFYFKKAVDREGYDLYSINTPDGAPTEATDKAKAASDKKSS